MKRLRLRCWGLLGTATVALLAGCPAADSNGPLKPIFSAKPAVPENADALTDRLIDVVNQARVSQGLKPLRKSAALTKLAEEYAARMIERKFFSHLDPDTGYGPGQRALQNGYLFLSVGENLAAGQTAPEAVLDDWMASTEGHRENILSVQWKDVGAAVRTGGEYGTYWVLEFGNPP
jgi:uncharacterized protein YkwD